MGNCLKITNIDDISLLRGGSSDLEHNTTDNSHHSSITSDASANLSTQEIGHDFNTDAPISAPLIYSELLQPVFLQTLTNLPQQTHHTYTSAGTGSILATATAPTTLTDGGIGARTLTGIGGMNTAQLPEEEQIRVAKRIGLIQHLPIGTYDGGTTKSATRECVICMIDFCMNEPIRYLPCMHAYHVRCIDDWLMRSLTCPSCMVPVDAALLLISFET